MDLVQEVERRALAAWPAEEVEELAGWRLRAMRGVTRRANSAWTGATRGALTLDDRIEQVERFYAARGLPTALQLVDRATPADLDDRLARRGYRIDAPVSVQAADAREIARAPVAAGVVTRVEGRAFEGWLEISARRGRFAAVEEIYRRLLDRIGPGARFCLAEIDGEPAGVGLGVIDGGWCGLFSMATLPDHRRRGVARAIVVALGRAAVAGGAASLYLQVERDNQSAGALYARFGFTERYGYHYRIGPVRG